MRVVADSTPLIALSAIGRFDLLKHLYHQVLVPEAVLKEVVQQGMGRPGASEFSAANWLRFQAPANAVEAIAVGLGVGETQAILLAEETPRADLLLIDEKLGRRAALARGLTVLGTVGVLQQAKNLGLVSAIKPELQNLISHGFFLSERTVELLLRLANER